MSRQLAHALIDRLPETQILGLVRVLETWVDPLSTALLNAELVKTAPERSSEFRASLHRSIG